MIVVTVTTGLALVDGALGFADCEGVPVAVSVGSGVGADCAAGAGVAHAGAIAIEADVAGVGVLVVLGVSVTVAVAVCVTHTTVPPGTAWARGRTITKAKFATKMPTIIAAIPKTSAVLRDNPSRMSQSVAVSCCAASGIRCCHTALVDVVPKRVDAVVICLGRHVLEAAPEPAGDASGGTDQVVPRESPQPAG